MKSTLLTALAVVLPAALLPAQDAAAQRLAGLTLEQKAGQLFMSWTLSRNDDGYELRDRVRGWVEQVGLGGVILSLGDVDSAAEVIAELQRRAPVPLLFAGDFETGVAFRLSGATDVGPNMLVGATGLARLARAAGRVTAEEGKAIGFCWSFSPVLDVNVNPRNPIINVRSFGERPALVARLGVASVEGLQGAGMMATGKHFPGHGDVSSDSHLTMPTVPGDRARLERIELVPFRAAVHEGVASIMTGHLAVPGLGEAVGVPATLSRRILHGLLREDMRFRGLIVTDALDMGGVREKLPPDEVAVQALLAGADMLLMPPDPLAARDAVVRAVRAGRVPEKRLDDAVLRVLRAKEAQGLFDGRTAPSGDFRGRLRTPEHLAVADEIARRGITMVKDDLGLVPLPAGCERPVLITLLDQESADVGPEFAQRVAGGAESGFEVHRVHPQSAAQAIAAAAEAARGSDLVVAALHVKVRSYSGRIGIPAALEPVVEAMREAPRAVVVSFGNPYLVLDLPNVSTYLCAFAATEHTERAAADVLRGRAGVTGRMPVAIPGVCRDGDGLSFLPGRGLERGTPEDEGMSKDLPRKIRALLGRAVSDRAFPGAVAMVSRRGRIVAEVAVGRETYDDRAPAIAPDAVYDLASLTKVCATTPAVLRLCAAGKLSLDTKVRDLVPQFQGDGKDGVTVRDLLTHTAGLPAFVRFFETLRGKDAIVEAAARTALGAEPGARYRYSDLGLILLMACVEKASGMPFDELVAAEVCEPLGMASARFAPSGEPLDAVPTEDCAFRGRVVRGEVHDENAYQMGGVSGHAGLFATAEDVTRIGVAFLGGGRGFLPAPLVRLAVSRAHVVPGSSRALGWDTFVPGGAGGSYLSPRAFGHTGFTGTSIWCDPERDLTIVLLSNRVHPTRANQKHARVRRDLADVVVRSIDD